jgi:hypothetical protein
MKIWLCKFAGLLEPEVLSGPFDNTIPDKEVIEAVKGSLSEVDLLFWIQVEITLTAEKKFIMTPKMGTFSGGYMDDMRSKALE